MQSLNFVLREKRKKARIGMGRQTKLVVLRLGRRIVRQPKKIMGPVKSLAEKTGFEVERDRVERQQGKRKGLQRIHRRNAGPTKAGKIYRPLIGAAETLVGHHVRVSVGDITFQKIGGNEVRLSRPLINLRRA